MLTRHGKEGRSALDRLATTILYGIYRAMNRKLGSQRTIRLNLEMVPPCHFSCCGDSPMTSQKAPALLFKKSLDI